MIDEVSREAGGERPWSGAELRRLQQAIQDVPKDLDKSERWTKVSLLVSEGNQEAGMRQGRTKKECHKKYMEQRNAAKLAHAGEEAAENDAKDTLAAEKGGGKGGRHFMDGSRTISEIEIGSDDTVDIAGFRIAEIAMNELVKLLARPGIGYTSEDGTAQAAPLGCIKTLRLHDCQLGADKVTQY